MPNFKIPGQYQATKALQARYVEGWQAAQAGLPHAYSTEAAADAFKRRYGRAQFDAYSAGYEAGDVARPDDGNEPGDTAA